MARWQTPEGLRAVLRRRWAAHAGDWLLGHGDWPLRLPLGAPTEAQAQAHWDLFEQWLRQWQAEACIDYVERRWSRYGRQRLPGHARFESAAAIADYLGERAAWERARQRCERLLARWPDIASALAAQFSVLAMLDEVDFERLIDVFDWLRAHPDSQLYPRQLPTAGIDSKWLDSGPAGLLREWLLAVTDGAAAVPARARFVDLAGLRSPPNRLHLRLLDPALRSRCGGLGDVLAPVADLASLRLPGLRRVFVVENLQTGLAFTDLPDSLVLIGRGYAVDALAQLPWLADLDLHYWGDLDTHGFAILHRLRGYLPQARSLLMDELTLLQHRTVWGTEDKPHPAEHLAGLTAVEAQLYAGLRADRWAPRLRLEQERIGWEHAWQAIARATASDGSPVSGPLQG